MVGLRFFGGVVTLVWGFFLSVLFSFVFFPLVLYTLTPSQQSESKLEVLELSSVSVSSSKNISM